MRVVTNGNHEEYSHLAPIVEPSQGIRPGKARCGFWTRGYTHHPLALERSSQNCTPYPNMGRKAKKKKAEKSRTLNIGTSQNKRSKSLVRPRSSSPASTSFHSYSGNHDEPVSRHTKIHLRARGAQLLGFVPSLFPANPPALHTDRTLPTTSSLSSLSSIASQMIPQFITKVDPHHGSTYRLRNFIRGDIVNQLLSDPRATTPSEILVLKFSRTK
jgi:hypothetical protein